MRCALPQHGRSKQRQPKVDDYVRNVFFFRFSFLKLKNCCGTHSPEIIHLQSTKYDARAQLHHHFLLFLSICILYGRSEYSGCERMRYLCLLRRHKNLLYYLGRTHTFEAINTINNTNYTERAMIRKLDAAWSCRLAMNKHEKSLSRCAQLRSACANTPQ